jgi:hypothetical protein
MTYKRKKYIPPEMYESWGGIFMPKKYEVKYKQTWVSAFRAAVVGDSLHYELYDDTEGVAKPGEWRVKGEPVVGTTSTGIKLVVTPVEEDDDNILEI